MYFHNFVNTEQITSRPNLVGFCINPGHKWTDKYNTTVIFYCYLNTKPQINKYINFLALHQHMNLIHYCEK